MIEDMKEGLPPGQTETKRFPVLSIDSIPFFDGKNWDVFVEGEVLHPKKFSWQEFLSLPSAIITSDFHCVTSWSRLDNVWEGVLMKTIADMVTITSRAHNATVFSEGFYSTSLTVDEILDNDVLLAYTHDGKPLAPEHGGPLRLVVPKKYAYKSVKWVRRILFTKEKELGFWETRGYSDSADPWKEEKYS